jgi:hypothetical protein
MKRVCVSVRIANWRQPGYKQTCIEEPNMLNTEIAPLQVYEKTARKLRPTLFKTIPG